MDCNDTLISTVRLTVSQPEFYYFHVKLIMDSSSDGRQVGADSELTVRGLLADAVKQLFGNVGSGCSIDVLKFDPPTQDVWIRVPYSRYRAVWQALTVAQFELQGRMARFQVVSNSAHLLGTVGRSRMMQ